MKIRTSTVVHTYGLSMWEVEAGGSLESKDSSLYYVAKTYLKTTKYVSHKTDFSVTPSFNEALSQPFSYLLYTMVYELQKQS